MNNLTLSITTIGDLLLKGKITQNENGNPIENVVLSIPEYQRPYKWTARNAIQLLDDIIEAWNKNKEVYRVGTLILHRNDKEYDIVDGQQRIITFSLLLYALYEQPGQDNGENEIQFLEQEVFNNQYNRYNIPTNLNAFRRRVQKENDENTKRLLREYIEKHCELIVIITDKQSEAFQFFDSQNARGKALYPHDLLKAYHLREMTDISSEKTEQIVREWEKIPQSDLADFFSNYLYRIKEWVNGNWAYKLDAQNIHKFKGINRAANTPYAQFYKSAYSYAELINSSSMPFVSGTREVKAFQLNAPIIAGKPFFDYTKHYYSILKDIQNNNQYQGFYINGNDIVKTLDKHYKYGKGNGIARLLFDTALLLYVDRYCPATFPTKADTDLFERFVVYAFIWAYSLRAQYEHLGWQSAQNYVLKSDKDKDKKINSLNIYKLIIDSDTPVSLLSTLDNEISPLPKREIKDKKVIKDNKVGGEKEKDNKVDGEEDGVCKNYLSFFKKYKFYTE